MRRRCYDTAFKDFPYYGGRGIAVCNTWRESFEQFYADMGDRPAKHTIDRIDVNGDYGPANCRWAIHEKQMNNTRRNRYLSYNGKTLSMADWAREVGIPYYRLRGRLTLCKWPLGKALGLEE
jgi:hypothetical protein